MPLKRSSKNYLGDLLHFGLILMLFAAPASLQLVGVTQKNNHTVMEIDTIGFLG
jgi:hypothetical protein